MYSYIGHHYVQVFYIYSENKGLYIYVVMPGDECLKHGSPHEDLLIHSQTNTRQKHPYKPASSVWLSQWEVSPKATRSTTQRRSHASTYRLWLW